MSSSNIVSISPAALKGTETDMLHELTSKGKGIGRMRLCLLYSSSHLQTYFRFSLLCHLALTACSITVGSSCTQLGFMESKMGFYRNMPKEISQTTGDSLFYFFKYVFSVMTTTASLDTFEVNTLVKYNQQPSSLVTVFHWIILYENGFSAHPKMKTICSLSELLSC